MNRNISPFPFRVELIKNPVEKSLSERLSLQNKIQELKDKLRVLIQSNFPILPGSTFLQPSAQIYMQEHFHGNSMGQDWTRNVLIQEMLMELSKLERQLSLTH